NTASTAPPDQRALRLAPSPPCMPQSAFLAGLARSSSSQNNSTRNCFVCNTVVLGLSQIYGAIAFYLDHQSEVRRYLEQEEERVAASSVPLSEANPELWSKLERAREALKKSSS
ncbi:MAG: hypothetical protein ACRD3O_06655, partial [Terriglobia bacterium]